MIAAVKLFLMWTAAAVWFLLSAYMSLTYFREALSADRGFFERPVSILTGIGALTVAALPLGVAALVHRFHRRRLRGRLIKEKEKIERRLRRLDEKQAAAERHVAPTSGVAGARES